MSKYFTSALALTAVLLSLTFATPVLAADDTVLATVNGENIMKKDVLEAIKTLPIKDAKVEEVYGLVVDQVINEKLIDAATKTAKIEESEDFKKRLDIIRSQLVKQIYLENAVKDKISDKAVKAEYDKFKKENKGKEEIKARHILVPSEEEAKQAIKDLDGGAKFEELATKRSSGPSAQNGGDLGYFAREDMLEEFSAAAFKLKKGEYTKEPVKTQFGWHVILVEDKRERKVPDLKEVEVAIKNKLGQDALKGLIDGLRAGAEIKRFDLDGKPIEKN